MLGRIGLLETRGGDRIQVEHTAEELRRLGVEVDIKTDLDYDPASYDLIHVFQLDWTPETYFYAKKAKQFKKPLVLSPIHHDVKEVKKYDDKFVFDIRRISKILFSDQFKRDTFKNVYKSLFDWRMLKPTLTSVFKGFKNMQREVLKMADTVLVQTVREAEDLKRTFDVEIRWEKVLNGVGRVYIEATEFEKVFKFDNYIICVGRVEPRKNQISIIEAVKKLREETSLDLHLVLVGQMSVIKHFEYNQLIKKCFKKYDWVHHVNSVPYKDLPSYYHYAKVCVSASWFETTGLTSLEALYCGTNAVASGLRAKEYLGGYASFCLPDDIKSIKNAIKKEYFAPRPLIDEKIRQEYTWENAAKRTLEVYKKVLEIKKK